MPTFGFNCKTCGSESEDVRCPYDDRDLYRPDCCGKPMRNTIGTFAFKVWNTDPATQTPEENARWCGVDI